MENALILTSKGSNDLNSCFGEVISRVIVFKLIPQDFHGEPEQCGWIDAADLFVLAPTLQVSLMLAGTQSFLLI